MNQVKLALCYRIKLIMTLKLFSHWLNSHSLWCTTYLSPKLAQFILQQGDIGPSASLSDWEIDLKRKIENISYYHIRPKPASHSDTAVQWDEGIRRAIDDFIRQQGQKISETLPVV